MSKNERQFSSIFWRILITWNRKVFPIVWPSVSFPYRLLVCLKNGEFCKRNSTKTCSTVTHSRTLNPALGRGIADAEIKFFCLEPRPTKCSHFNPGAGRNLSIHARPPSWQFTIPVSAFVIHSTVFFQSSSNTRWRVTRTVSRTSTCESTTCVSASYDPSPTPSPTPALGNCWRRN